MVKPKVPVALACVLLLSGCISRLQIAAPLDVTVVDADDGAPIPGAEAIYLVCDVHDFDCDHAILEQPTTDESGAVKISGRRQWGVWFPAPGGLPVPNHFIAIWARGYSAFVFSQYDDTLESMRKKVRRQDVSDALESIPSDQSSSDPSLNPREQLTGGKIRLRKSASFAASSGALSYPASPR